MKFECTLVKTNFEKKVIIQLEQGAISNCLRQASFFDRNYGGPITGQPEHILTRTSLIQRQRRRGRRKGVNIKHQEVGLEITCEQEKRPNYLYKV